MNNKTVKITLSEHDYKIIREEASSKMQSVPAFIRLCIASYVNKRFQGRVFGKNE